MTKFGTVLVGAALAVMATSAARAQTFSYTTSFVPVVLQSASGFTTLNLGPGSGVAQDASLAGGANIVPVNMQLVGGTPGGDPLNASFLTTIDIRDDADPLTAHQFSFNTNVNLLVNTTTASGSVNIVENGGQPVFEFDSLGRHFRVATFSVVPPQGPGASRQGSIGAKVTATTVPEPGSLALLGTALLPLAGLARRRK